MCGVVLPNMLQELRDNGGFSESVSMARWVSEWTAWYKRSSYEEVKIL